MKNILKHTKSCTYNILTISLAYSIISIASILISNTFDRNLIETFKAMMLGSTPLVLFCTTYGKIKNKIVTAIIATILIIFTLIYMCSRLS